MLKYPWPGNVRELKNFIERIYILTNEEFVDVHDLRFAGLTDFESGSAGSGEDLSTFREARAQFEKEYLLKKIGENSGNISANAASKRLPLAESSTVRVIGSKLREMAGFNATSSSHAL